MPKPICVIKIDIEGLIEAGGNKIDFSSAQEKFENRFGNEYYVLIVPMYNANDEPVSLEVFYEKDFTEIQYEELKQIILNHLHDKA